MLLRRPPRFRWCSSSLLLLLLVEVEDEEEDEKEEETSCDRCGLLAERRPALLLLQVSPFVKHILELFPLIQWLPC